ncbi:hypothetical protein EDD18DRAFT_1109220 [Armillaria luteobubalina]|uniref:Uncharacterized protein n=1 Tax=Armillaria luteobubalina TaxID=153913 RepID=A0AA39PWZ8_9AGAR|nr:hypothetical protein EDD18DRAFT_1109220 [Armillaria luteobubalina]
MLSVEWANTLTQKDRVDQDAWSSQKCSLASLDGTETVKYAAKARESSVKRMRNADRDDAFDGDREESEDEVCKDETQHACKLSYANEAGSSLDLDVVDSSPGWEKLMPEEPEIAELQACADERERQAPWQSFKTYPRNFWTTRPSMNARLIR